jgi:hypothetical protein
MQTRSYPTRPTSPTPAIPTSEPALHLLRSVWVASCPTCGFQLTSARTQARCERRAAGKACPICYWEAR